MADTGWPSCAAELKLRSELAAATSHSDGDDGDDGGANVRGGDATMATRRSTSSPAQQRRPPEPPIPADICAPELFADLLFELHYVTDELVFYALKDPLGACIIPPAGRPTPLAAMLVRPRPPWFRPPARICRLQDRPSSSSSRTCSSRSACATRSSAATSRGKVHPTATPAPHPAASPTPRSCAPSIAGPIRWTRVAAQPRRTAPVAAAPPECSDTVLARAPGT